MFIENTKAFPGTGGVFGPLAQDHVGLTAKDVVLVKIADGNWVYLPPREVVSQSTL